MKKPQVLLISGSGRSGTTVLSLLLSQESDVYNIGQIRDIWTGWQKEVTCACGHTLSSCPFWGSVKALAFSDLDSEGFVIREKAMRSFMLDAASREKWEDPNTLRDLSKRHAWYLNEFRKLLNAILEITTPSMLVDSSKSPEIALAFQLVGGFDLFILNLIRDPRAVAFSWKKKGKTNTKRTMQTWLDRHRRLSGWPTAAGIQTRHLSYERFADTPHEILAKVLVWTGHSLPEGVFVGPHSVEVSWNKQHLFPPSNETVLSQKKTKFDILAPVEWKRLGTWRTQLFALWQTFPEGPAYALKKLRQKCPINLGTESSDWI